MSARKAQMLAKEYKAKGGGYKCKALITTKKMARYALEAVTKWLTVPYTQERHTERQVLSYSI